MSKCQNCNYELNGAVFCPQCGTKAEAAKIPVVDEVPATVGPKIDDVPATTAAPNVTGNAPTVSGAPDYQPQPQNVNTQQPVAPQPFPQNQQGVPQQMPYQPQFNYGQPQMPAQPSVAGETFKKAFMCFKHFFSKNAGRELTVQHNEKTNMWIILFALTALLSAISCCIHRASTATDILGITDMPYSLMYNRVGDFFIGLALMAAFEFSFVMVLFLYSRIIKKKPLTFTSSANIVAAAIVPVSIVAGTYVIIGHYAGFFNIIGLFLFVYILKKSMDNAFGENGESFWSFFIVLAVALTTYMIASAIFSIPGWIFNSLENSITYGMNNLIDPYLW